MTAAALGNPGLATWGALLQRAKLKPGEVVLVNGATGTTGRQAVQVAKWLGASQVVGTGRNAHALEDLKALGVDETVQLPDSPGPLSATFGSLFQRTRVDVVLDYLWGASAEAILHALAGGGSLEGEPKLRFVQVGSISGGVVALDAHLLRSSGVELVGSGLGSLSSQEILGALRTMYATAERIPMHVACEAVPLEDLEATWQEKSGSRRIVFVP